MSEQKIPVRTIEDVANAIAFMEAMGMLKDVCNFMVKWKQRGLTAPLDLDPVVDAVVAVDDVVMSVRRKLGYTSSRPPVSIEDAMAVIEKAATK